MARKKRRNSYREQVNKRNLEKELRTPNTYNSNKRSWAKYAKVNTDINASLSSATTTNQTVANIRNMLQDPIANATSIGSSLQTLYYKDGAVSRIINYFTSLLTYNYSIYPTMDLKTGPTMSADMNEYFTVAEYIDRHDIKLNAPRFVRQAFIHGVAFFYEVITQSGVVYMEFPYGMCRIALEEDGVYRWMIDITAVTDDMVESPGFPNEIINAREQGPQEDSSKWVGDYYIIGNKGFAITFDGSAIKNGGIGISPFAMLLSDSIDIEKAKENIDVKDDIDAVRLIHGEIELNDQGEPIMTSDDAMEWQMILAAGLPEGVTPTITPFKINNIPLAGAGNKGAYETVSDAQKQLYKSVGVPSSVFGDSTTSSNIVKLSVQKDAVWMFKTVIPTLTAYYNSVLKKAKTESGHVWKIKILEQDTFNKSDIQKLYKDSNTVGASRLDYLASMDNLPSEAYTKLMFEQQVMGIDNIMTPKPTSHTMSGINPESSGAGRPVEENPTDDTDRINDSK